MKKKRFYNDKKRNTKWTEQKKGRKIYFAEKYIDAGSGYDKFDNRRPKPKKPVFSKAGFSRLSKWLIIALGCFVIVSIGYTVMDLYIERNAMPLTQSEEDDAGVSNVTVEIKGAKVQSLALDNGVMLDTVIDEVQKNGYTAAAFDVKRDDGTIGYDSNLAVIDMYGAESSPAGNAPESVKRLTANDILPVGIIACYKDNVLTHADSESAVTINGELYEDENGSCYLNPDNTDVYNYIKGIIEEVKAMGVNVFVLTDCDLPDEIKNGYNDGFDTLAEKLYNDFGNEIKLINAVKISISAESVKKINEEWAEKTEGIENSDLLFCVTAKDESKVRQTLSSKNGINYIIQE